MSRQLNTGIGRRHEQLPLALFVQAESFAPGTSVSSGPRAHAGSTLSPRAREAARAVGPSSSRVRRVPSRDSHGRFVSFPTTTAPSWYVFCCDGYRILGEATTPAPAAIAPASPAPRRPKPRKPRFQITHWDVANVALVVLVLIAAAWYRLHLVVPHR